MELIGFLLPPLIDLINRKVKDTDVRFWVSIVVCLLIATVIATVEVGKFSFTTDFFQIIGIKSMALFGMSQISYKKAWEDSDLRDSLKLNVKTL